MHFPRAAWSDTAAILACVLLAVVLAGYGGAFIFAVIQHLRL
jgi:hypothetical protein